MTEHLTDIDMNQVVTAARVAHEVNRIYCASIGDDSQPAWDDAPAWQQSSAVDGVLHVLRTPNATPEDSHNNWMMHKNSEGWTWGPEKDPAKKRHPCMVPYDQLDKSQQVKDALFIACVKNVLDLA